MNRDRDFLEREYNPRVQIPQFAEYFGRWKERAREVRGALECRLDLPYGPAAAETVDFFPAAMPSARWPGPLTSPPTKRWP